MDVLDDLGAGFDKYDVDWNGLGGHPVAPTLVGTSYGMELHPHARRTFGYPLALVLVLFLGFILDHIFKARTWL